MKDWIRELESVECSFWACEGSHKDKIQDMVTCRKCRVIYEMRQAISGGNLDNVRT